MTARQMGKRLNSVAAQRRRKSSKQKYGHKSIRRKDEPLQARETRELFRMVVSGGLFVLLVFVKILLPEQAAQIRGTLYQAMEQNVDVQAVFSAIGSAFSGAEKPKDAFREVYQAVFAPDESQSIQKTAVNIAGSTQALKELGTYIVPRTDNDAESAVEQMQTDTLRYVLYSEENLPENVSMEQIVLGFDYSTPLSGAVSSGFGFREHPTEGEGRFHYGIDLAADTGTEISCFADGIVTATGESSSYGKYCIVWHEREYSTLYAHCSRITISSGAQVKRGEKIAEVGETGMATGPHLHFELQKGQTYLNPVYYVEKT